MGIVYWSHSCSHIGPAEIRILELPELRACNVRESIVMVSRACTNISIQNSLKRHGAIFSVPYNISPLNFAIYLLILRCSFYLFLFFYMEISFIRSMCSVNRQ